jgi:hypothetical protein
VSGHAAFVRVRLQEQVSQGPNEEAYAEGYNQAEEIKGEPIRVKIHENPSHLYWRIATAKAAQGRDKGFVRE